MPKTGMEPLRRRELISAAIESIHAQGMAQVTMGDIARRAGVSAGLAHHYFGGKDQLLSATMRHLLSDLGEEIQAQLASVRGPRERLSAIIRGNFAPCQFRPAVVSAWLAFYVAAQTDKQARRLLHIYRRRLESNLLHELQKLTSRTDAARIAETIASLIDGLWIRHSLNDAESDSAGAVAVVESALDDALRRTHA